jgi:hypothetical protein
VYEGRGWKSGVERIRGLEIDRELKVCGLLGQTIHSGCSLALGGFASWTVEGQLQEKKTR